MAQSERAEESLVMIVINNQPHYVGFRAAEIARLLVEDAALVNRDDLESLEIRVSGQPDPRAIDPHWKFRGKRRRY